MGTILLNRKKCIGCAICTDALPYVFLLDEDDGKALLVGQTKIKDFQKIKYPLDHEIASIADRCPVKAIDIL